MKQLLNCLTCLWKADAFSPTAFVARGCMIALCFGVSKIAGLGEYTTFLSGTSGNPDVSWQTAATLGLVHLLLYLAFILLVPASVITAGLLFVFNKWVARRQNCRNKQPTAVEPLISQV